MSGGSMDYLSYKIECGLNFSQETPLRKAFVKHMVKVIQALHDIEWVDSGDSALGDEDEAIAACLQSGDELSAILDEAKRIKEWLEEALLRTEKKLK